MKDVRHLDAEILDRGQHDDVGLFEIVSVLSLACPEMTAESVRDTALAAVRRLVGGGLVDAGAMTDDGFVPRTDDLDALLNEVRVAYDGDIMGTWQYRLWVRTTPEGDRAAQQAAANPERIDPPRG